MRTECTGRRARQNELFISSAIRTGNRMAASSATLHESTEQLRPETIDRHRAVVSIMEELEAIDWYDQRIDAAQDEELRQLLAHNRDEEKEHAAMMLEWLRKHDSGLDEHLRTYLFASRPVLEIEEQADAACADSGGQQDDTANTGSLNIGSLRDTSSHTGMPR